MSSYSRYLKLGISIFRSIVLYYGDLPGINMYTYIYVAEFCPSFITLLLLAFCSNMYLCRVLCILTSTHRVSVIAILTKRVYSIDGFVVVPVVTFTCKFKIQFQTEEIETLSVLKNTNTYRLIPASFIFSV